MNLYLKLSKEINKLGRFKELNINNLKMMNSGGTYGK